MSEQKKSRPKVPTGESQYLTTTQKQATESGYVGYDTDWKPFQKEVAYSIPKKP